MAIMRRKAGSIIAIEQAVLAAGLDLQRQGADEFHGYLLAGKMREAAEARRLVAHGTLYKALDRLEGYGMIESRWEDPEAAFREGRPRRRLYRVTPAGSAAVAAAMPQRAHRGLQLRPETGP